MIATAQKYCPIQVWRRNAGLHRLDVARAAYARCHRPAALLRDFVNALTRVESGQLSIDRAPRELLELLEETSEPGLMKEQRQWEEVDLLCRRDSRFLEEPG